MIERFGNGTTRHWPIYLLMTILAAWPAWAEVHLSVVAAPSVARPGETLDVTFTISNDGPFDNTDLALVFDFPEGLAFFSESLFAGGCSGSTCDPGEEARIDIGTLPVGSGVSFSMPVQVAGGVVNGTVIPFTAHVFDDDSLLVSATANMTVDNGRELELSLVNDRDPVAPGGSSSYTLTYGVLKTSAGSTGTELRFTLPVGTQLVSASGNAVEEGGELTWTLGNLNPGATGEQTVTVWVAANLDPGTIITAAAQLQDVSAAVTYGEATRIETEPPLVLNMVAGPDPARPGETLDIELTVTNNGSADRTGVSLALEFRDHLAFFSESLFDGNCSGSTCDPQERAFFNLGTIPAGKGVTYSMPARVAAGTLDGTVVVLEAEVSDATGATRTSGTSFAVDATRDLELALIEDRDPAAPGELLSYTLTYGVLATSPGSPGAELIFHLPAGTHFVSAGGSGMFADGAVRWSLGNLNPGVSGERTVLVALDDGLTLGTIIPSEAHFIDSSPTPKRVVYQAATRVQNPSPFKLSMAASPDPVRPDETLDLEVTLTNSGSIDRTGVLMTLAFPDHIDFLSESLFDGACSGSSCDPQERAFFEVGTVPAGKGVTFSLPAWVAGGTLPGTVISFEAEVTDATGELLESGNSFAVLASRELELALVENRDPVAPGETITYTLTYGVLDSSAGAPGTTLTFSVPTGTNFLSATDGGTLSQGLVNWSLGNLNPGASGERSVTLQVANSAGYGDIINASAWLQDSAARVKRVDDQATTRVDVPIPLQLSLTAAPDTARRGELMDVALRVGNVGPFDRTGVVLVLEYPDHLDFLSENLIDGSCSGSSCDPRERVFFNIGTVPAGGGVVYSLPVAVAGGTMNGTVITLEADVYDGSGDQRETATSFAVDGDRDLDLAIHASSEPVLPGETVTYTVTYGAFVGTTGSPDARLWLTLPANVQVENSSDCTLSCCNVVEWSLCNLNPGEGGSRSITVRVPEDTPPGEILQIEAEIIDMAVTPNRVRAQIATRVENARPLRLGMTLTPNPISPGEDLGLQLSVTNDGVFDRSDVLVTLEFPEHLNFLSESLIDGVCSGSSCDPRERVFFDIGTLGSGETVTLPVPPTVSGNTPAGAVIGFDAFVYDSTSFIGNLGAGLLVGANGSCVPVCNEEEHLLLYHWISNRIDNFESIVIANNYGDTAVTVTLTATRPGEQPETVMRTIPAHGFLEESAATLFPVLGSGGGYSVLLRSPSERVRGGWVTNSLTAPSGASPSQGVAVRIPEEGDVANTRVGREVVFGYLPVTGNNISAPVVVNLEETAADVTLRFFDAAGTEVGNRTENLAPYEPFAALANGLIAEGSGDVYMTATSDNLISGVSFVFDSAFVEPAIGNANRIDTAAPEGGPKTLFYPWVSNRAELFASVVVVNNYGATPVEVSFTAMRGDGETSATVGRVIPADALFSELASELFPDLGDGAGYNVTLVSSSDKVNGQWVTNNLAAASQSSPSQGVAIDIAGDPERLGQHLLFGYLPVTGSFISAPVVVNAGEANTNVTLRFYDADGVLVAEDSQTLRDLAPGRPFAALANSLLPPGTGNVYMIASSDGEPITGVSFVFNSEFNEPAIGNATAIDFQP